MKISFKSISAALIALAAAACSSPEKMAEMAENVIVKCEPAVLEVVGGVIDAEVSVTYPADYFHPKAILEVTPVIVYEGGEAKMEPYMFQGEKVEDNYEVVPSAGATITKKVHFEYVPGMENCYLELRGVATNKKKSIGDFEMQLEFLWDELQDYKSMMKQLKEATSVKEASDLILHDFEAPADQSAAVEEKRAGYGQKYFDKYAECKHTTTELVNKKDATCSAAGYTGDTKCSKCGKIIKEGELVPTIPHVYELKDAVDATYNQGGYTGNKVCKVCGHTQTGTSTDKVQLPSLDETETDESIDISISRNWLVKFIKWLLGLLKK